MTSKFTSLSEIIERVYRTTDNESIAWSDAAEDCLDVLRLIGVPQSYIDRSTNGQGNNPTPIIIDNFKGDIPLDVAVPGPCRLIQLNSAFEIASFKMMVESQDLFYQSPTVREQAQTSVSDYSSTLVATSLELKMDEVEADLALGTTAGVTLADAALDDVVDDIRQSQSRIVTSATGQQQFSPMYKLNSDYMFTNFKSGFVEMSYKAYPVDEFGMPMIPDNIKFIKAVEWYLISRIDYKRWRTTRNLADEKMWKVSDTEALWYIQSARTAARVPSLSQMESIKRMLLRSIPKVNQFAQSFKTSNIGEQRKF
jgi:hypothetical protein